MINSQRQGVNMFKFETKEELLEFLKSDEGEGFEISNELKKPLLNKRDDLLSEVKTLKGKLSTFDSVDIDGLKEKASKADELESKLKGLSKSDEKYDELKRSLEEQLTLERQKHEKFVNQYTEQAVDSRITQAISRNSGIPELLKPIVKSRVKPVLSESGDVSMEVLSQDGKPYFVNGKEATVDDIVNELKNDEIYARAFNGSGASGTGTRKSNATSGGVVLDPDDPNYSLTKAMEYKKNNPQAA